MEKVGTRELTKAEEKLYAREVKAAKIKELTYSIEHKCFSSRKIKQL